MKVYFFDNGNSCVFNEKDQQVASLNKSWLLLYVEFLKSKGLNPTDFEFKMPNAKIAKIFKMEDGNYNWRIEDVE